MCNSTAQVELIRTDNSHPDFLGLIRLLDEELAGRYGELQKQYDRHNTLDKINDVVIAYRGSKPAACGAFKQYDAETVEVKRMYVSAEHRRQGLAKMVLNELEAAARQQGYRYAILETGIKQFEAISLYRILGYCIIGNYGQYTGNVNSVCMRKSLY